MIPDDSVRAEARAEAALMRRARAGPNEVRNSRERKQSCSQHKQTNKDTDRKEQADGGAVRMERRVWRRGKLCLRSRAHRPFGPALR